MDPRIPFPAPRDHGEEIANATFVHEYEAAAAREAEQAAAFQRAYIREHEEARDGLWAILIIALCIAATIGGVAWAVSKYLAINHPL